MPVPSADASTSSTANASTANALQTPPAPLCGFTAEEFRSRRAALSASCADGIVFLRGSVEEEAVHPGRYKQNSNFMYFTGVETPGAMMVLLPAGLSATIGLRGVAASNREILFLPARNPLTETWTGPKLGHGAETEKATGFENCSDVSSFLNGLMAWVRYNPIVYTVAPFGESAKFTREFDLIQKLTSIAPTIQLRDCSLKIGNQRMVKSAAEIEKIEAAIAITHDGQRGARALIASGEGKREYEAEGVILNAFRSKGATLAFGSIVGGGINGTVLHYEDNNNVMNAGELVVVDIGAKVDGYCGDITRTYPVGGVFGGRERDIYNTVLEAHQRTISGFTLGETLQNLTDRCKAFYKESPLRSKNAAGIEVTLDSFMPHGLSHHLGLDVHDVGDRELPLPVGSVITVEPGLYLPAEKIGVRIEDDYLVTESGLKRLGPPLESTVLEIEAAQLAARQSHVG